MSRKVYITLSTPNNTYNIYTGLTSETTNSLVCAGVTNGCVIDFNEYPPNEYVWIRVSSLGCDDQLFYVYIGPLVTTYDDYLAEQYECGTCNLIASNILVALPVGTTVNIGDEKYYSPSFGSGQQGIYTYKITATTTGGPGLILETIAYTDCESACIGIA